MIISGINYATYIHSLNKKILFLGEMHTGKYCESEDTNILEVLKTIILKNKCTDIFFEGLFKDHEEMLMNISYMNKLPKYFKSHPDFMKYTRIHFTDARYLHGIEYPTFSFLNGTEFYSKISYHKLINKPDINDSVKIDIIIKLYKQEQEIINNLLKTNLTTIVNFFCGQESIDKMIDILKDIENESLIIKQPINYYILNKWYKFYLPIITKSISKFIDTCINMYKNHHSIIDLLICAPMDIMTLSRIFIKFDITKSTRHYCNDNINNIIIYGGYIHMKLYKSFFNIIDKINLII
jgi:hypothetical protein